MKPSHNVSKHQIPYHPIQCKILFENCAGQQVLGTFVKLVSKTLPDAYAVFEQKVILLQEESFLGINICNSILTDLQFGRFVKNKNIKDIKMMVKQWIMEYATKCQPFLVVV